MPVGRTSEPYDPGAILYSSWSDLGSVRYGFGQSFGLHITIGGAFGRPRAIIIRQKDGQAPATLEEKSGDAKAVPIHKSLVEVLVSSGNREEYEEVGVA